MSLEEQYLINKKKELIRLVNIHNEHAIGIDHFEIKSNYSDLDIDKTFCSSSSCKTCGGSCCKEFPCVFAPNDFLDINNHEYILNILKTGLVVLAVSHNIKNVYLRPRGLNDEKWFSTIRLPGKHYSKNPCILHTKNGCLLESQYRPSEGLLFICNNFNRIPIYTENQYEIEYEKYQELLVKLFYDYLYKDIDIDLSQNCIEENVKQLQKSLCGYKN